MRASSTTIGAAIAVLDGMVSPELRLATNKPKLLKVIFTL
ncbi:hypothetical protein GARC_2971 [Paraglaciecola arctica BSs20135]|uniref:Uncharacterized protein n=1 Tax=Paraglaciecola arctica BSs20135 TaxID=493475 RepID=K6XH14_9ALTE|nr:hypothetical protein GARC_2971 [Paraglaciecola arctica BSs20135]